MKRSLVLLFLAASWTFALDNTPRVPTIDDLLMVKSVGDTEISPDGRRVAYTVRETDVKADAFLSQIWLAEPASGQPVQPTRPEQSSSNTQGSPAGSRLALL